MKLTLKPVLGASILLAILVAAPLVYSGGQHAKGMDGMSGTQNAQMMDMNGMQNQMQNMSEIMNEAHNTKDINQRYELMQKHMSQMQNMMGNMQGMMGDNMPGNMSMEQRQEIMAKRINVMQGMMEQMLKQQSMMIDKDK
jgi:hypothetical protein